MKTIGKDDIGDYLEKGFLHCRCIIELVGAPEQYIKDTIQKYVEKISETKNIKLISAKIEEPTKERGLFAVFAELEFMVKSPDTLVFFCFDYMPASIEIMAPEDIRFRAADFTVFFNDFMARLHKVDMLVKDLTAKNKNLLKNSNRILRNMVVVTLAYNGPLTADALGEKIGIKGGQLLPFLKEMEKEQWIIAKDGKWQENKNRPAEKK